MDNNKKLIEYRFRPYDFRAYGLNEKRNCFESNKVYELTSMEELASFAIESLKICGCDNCALFTYDLNGTMCAFVKQYAGEFDPDDYTEEELDELEDMDYEDLVSFDIKCYSSELKDDFDFFSSVDEEFRLCCYGLVIQQIDKMWRVV